jgi:hypothetical protein
MKTCSCWRVSADSGTRKKAGMKVSKVLVDSVKGLRLSCVRVCVRETQNSLVV